MVGVQAMVLGRVGRKPFPHPRACALSCPSPTIGGPGSLGHGHLTRPAVLWRIIPDDMDIPLLDHLALSGRPDADIHGAVNFASTGFSEVACHSAPAGAAASYAQR